MIDYELLMGAQAKNPVKEAKNKMAVGFVIPPSSQVLAIERQFARTSPYEGVTCVATVLKNAGHRIKIIDVRNSGKPLDRALKEIDDVNVIMLATYFDSFSFCEEFTNALKTSNNDKPVILGGPLVSSDPELVLGNLEADIAIVGEGELTALELFQCLEENKGNYKGLDYSEIRGMAFKDNNGLVVKSKFRPQIKDLDNTPMLDFSVWPSIQNNPALNETLFSSTRGCFKRCVFCYRVIRSFRAKSFQRLRDEIYSLKKKHNVQHFWLNDLTFVSSKERALALCKIFKDLGIKWSCTSRVEDTDAHLLRTMKESGCLRIEYGIESFDQAVLDDINKDITLAQVRRTVKLTIDAGIFCSGLFIIGLPTETEQSLEAMNQFMEESGLCPRVKYLVPFPGTEIYDLAIDKKLIKSGIDFLRNMSKRTLTENDDILNFTNLPTETLRKYFRMSEDIRDRRLKEYSKKVNAAV